MATSYTEQYSYLKKQPLNTIICPSSHTYNYMYPRYHPYAHSIFLRNKLRLKKLGVFI
jgi:hypothetical protein